MLWVKVKNFEVKVKLLIFEHSRFKKVPPPLTFLFFNISNSSSKRNISRSRIAKKLNKNLTNFRFRWEIEHFQNTKFRIIAQSVLNLCLGSKWCYHLLNNKISEILTPYTMKSDSKWRTYGNFSFKIKCCSSVPNLWMAQLLLQSIRGPNSEHVDILHKLIG